MSHHKPISFSLLQEFADSKHIYELTAEKLPNGNGFYLIVRTRSGMRVVQTTRYPQPKVYKSLDAVANEVSRCNMDNFSVTGIREQSRSSRVK